MSDTNYGATFTLTTRPAKAADRIDVSLGLALRKDAGAPVLYPQFSILQPHLKPDEAAWFAASLESVVGRIQGRGVMPSKRGGADPKTAPAAKGKSTIVQYGGLTREQLVMVQGYATGLVMAMYRIGQGMVLPPGGGAANVPSFDELIEVARELTP